MNWSLKRDQGWIAGDQIHQGVGRDSASLLCLGGAEVNLFDGVYALKTRDDKTFPGNGLEYSFDVDSALDSLRVLYMNAVWRE